MATLFVNVGSVAPLRRITYSPGIRPPLAIFGEHPFALLNIGSFQLSSPKRHLVKVERGHKAGRWKPLCGLGLVL